MNATEAHAVLARATLPAVYNVATEDLRERIRAARAALSEAADVFDLENYSARQALNELAAADEFLQQIEVDAARSELALAAAMLWLREPERMCEPIADSDREKGAEDA